MDGDNKKLGFRKRTKPKEGGFDADDDEPIGSLLKLKRPRNSKRNRLGIDDCGERDKLIDKKVEKLTVQDEDFGGMDDTLASFRKKLRRPKKVSGSEIHREQISALSEAESVDPLPSMSREKGDIGTRSKLLTVENGELMKFEESDIPAKIVVEKKYEAPDFKSNFKDVDGHALVNDITQPLQSGFNTLKGTESGLCSRGSSNSPFDKQLKDSLSAFVQKIQCGSTRKSLISSNFKQQSKDEGLEDQPSYISRDVSGDYETCSTGKPSCSVKLTKYVKKPKSEDGLVLASETSTSHSLSCTHCTGGNYNSRHRQCQGVQGDVKECQHILKDLDRLDVEPRGLNEDSKFFIRVPERKVTFEIKNGLKQCSSGDAIVQGSLEEVTYFQEDIVSHNVNENIQNSCSLEQIKEDWGSGGRVSGGENLDVMAQMSKALLSYTTLGVDIKEKGGVLTNHEELIKAINLCESTFESTCKSTQNVNIYEKSANEIMVTTLQSSSAFDSTKGEKTCSNCDSLNAEADGLDITAVSEQNENARMSLQILSKTTSRVAQKSTDTSDENCQEVHPIGNFSLDNCQPSKGYIGMDAPNNDIMSVSKEVKASSPGSLTPDDNESYHEDVISVPGSEKDCKLPASLRAVRKSKKTRHVDMAYEGDIDWEVLINERAIDSDHSSRSRRDSASTSSSEAENGGRAAVSAGLKAHAVSLLEKIKFKEVLKRKGGIQEYLTCRNQVLGLWYKDVTRILHLVDCGVTGTPSIDEPPRASLVREIYEFLNLRGYINVGIASEKGKSESDFLNDCEVRDKKIGVTSVADFENRVSVDKSTDVSKAKVDGTIGGEELEQGDPKSCSPVTAKNLELPKPLDDDQLAILDEKGSHDPNIPGKLADMDLLGEAPSHSTHESTIGLNTIDSMSDDCLGGKLCNPVVKRKVIVIGAGPAGLTAAKHLHRQGFTVTVLEARNRVGGRVHTDRSSLSVPVDLGASIITGVEADVATERRPDPSSLICTQLGLNLTVLNSDCPLYDIVTSKKVPVDMDESLEAEYNSLLDDMVLLVAQKGEHAVAMSLEEGLEYALKCRRMARLGRDISSEEEILSPFERRVMDWHFANLEYGCATLLKEVSLPHWNQDDVYGGFGGAHCMIKGGYSSVVEALGEGLPVHLNHVVADVSYSTSDTGLNENSSAKVKVSTTNGSEFLGDAVLVTVPLGCLKAETINFSPPLPLWKRLSIQRLGFGVLNKIVLEFSEVFWDDSVDYFGATAEETNWRGQCFMFWNVRKTVGAPVLIALVVGNAARERQYMSSSDHVNHALMVLRKLFGEALVPDPVASVVTDWGRDPFSYGAYSYVAVGASGEDYDIIGRPVDNCLFFAGEATCKEHPDTVGGAMMSGLREAVRIVDILSNGYDYTAEVEAMEAAQRQSECENDEVGDISTRLDALEFSDALYKNSFDGASILTREALLKDLFFSAKTTAGRLHVAKELLNLSVETLKSFAGTREGLRVLNLWILDSMGKDATQLLRHCVRILVLVSTDLLAVRLSGIGKTVKEKVCVHTSRDIRAIASQLVSIWLEVFRKEKAVNGRLKLSKSNPTVDSSKRKSNRDLSSGKPPLHANNGALESKGNLQSVASAGVHLHSDMNMKNDNSKQLKLEMESSSKSDISSSRSRGSCGRQDIEMEGNIAMTEEEQAAFAAAEAARAAAVAAAKAYASTEAKCLQQLPKIPSFHKFARREHYAQMDDCDYKRKLSGSVLGRQDCISEIDSRNYRVRNWSLEFSAACVNLESSRMSADNLSQRSHSNEIVSQLNFREHSGESAAVDSSLYTKAWVDTAGSVGMKDYHAIERWRTQAAAAHVTDEEDSNTNWTKPTWNDHLANESSISQVTMNKESVKSHHRGADRIKQAVVDYVASLLMPLYKARKIDKDGYKSIMKKSATKVMEQATDSEKGMTVSEFLDFKRRNKIRAFVDKLIERHMAVKPMTKS